MVIYKNEKDIIDYLGLTDNLDYFNNNKRSILKAVKIAERLKADYILECDFNNIYENHDLKQKLRINGIVIFEVYEKKEENYLKNISQELKKMGWEWESQGITLKRLIQDDYKLLDTKFQNQEPIPYEEIGFALDLMRAVLNDEID